MKSKCEQIIVSMCAFFKNVGSGKFSQKPLAKKLFIISLRQIESWKSLFVRFRNIEVRMQ